MRILLIEDNQDIVHVIKQCLYRFGNDLTYTLSGLDGIQMARLKDFDLYLVDLDLPDMSGLHVGLALARLAQRGKLRRSPIVAVTAQSDTATRNRAMRYGFSAFLGKPFTEAEIVGLVRHFEQRKEVINDNSSPSRTNGSA